MAGPADGDREALIEAAAAAHRERAPGGTIRFHPAWWDLDDAGRRDCFAAIAASRALEAALDPEGLSTTARAVLRRIGG